MARDFNPDTGNVPDGLYEVVNVHGKVLPNAQEKHLSLITDKDPDFLALFFGKIS